jgi:hypothetical protein
MKSILEKALVHLLNEDVEKAQELMHQFVVEQARAIHESLREGDECDMDAMDDTLEENEFFTEADLEDTEAAEQLEDDLDDNDGGDIAGGDDFGGEEVAADDLDAAEVEGGDDMGAEMGDDMGGEGDMAEKLDTIEDEIASLQAEFEKIMAEFDGGDEMDATDEAGDDFGDDVEVADADAVDAPEFGGETEEEDEQDFDRVTESMVDDLKKVSVPNEDGRGATGQKLSTPTTSPIAKDAKPTVLRSKNTVGHTGWERETAPSKKDGPDRGRKYDNNRSKATDGNEKMPATGPKKAEINKPVAGNNKSVIPGKKSGK